MLDRDSANHERPQVNCGCPFTINILEPDIFDAGGRKFVLLQHHVEILEENVADLRLTGVRPYSWHAPEATLRRLPPR